MVLTARVRAFQGCDMVLTARVQAFHNCAVPLSAGAGKCNKIVYVTVVQNRISFEVSDNLFMAISE